MSTAWHRPFILLFCSLFLAFGVAAAEPGFTVEIGKPVASRKIPSGSALVAHNSGFYVVGDNAVYLYEIDQNFKKLDKTVLPSASQQKGVRRGKKAKPDFEAMTSLSYEGRDWILIIGSGSKPGEREFAHLIAPDRRVHHERRISDLYAQFFALSGQYINIEGLAVAGPHVYFLARGGIDGSAIYRARLDDVVAFMTGSRARIEPVEYFSARLPATDGHTAGFSGAVYWPEAEALLFTATIERDGDSFGRSKVLVSHLGLLRPADLRAGQPIDLSKSAVRLERKGKTLRTKAESLAITASDKQSVSGVLVSDNDDGDSVFMRFSLKRTP